MCRWIHCAVCLEDQVIRDRECLTDCDTPRAVYVLAECFACRYYARLADQAMLIAQHRQRAQAANNTNQTQSNTRQN